MKLYDFESNYRLITLIMVPYTDWRQVSFLVVQFPNEVKVMISSLKETLNESEEGGNSPLQYPAWSNSIVTEISENLFCDHNLTE